MASYKAQEQKEEGHHAAADGDVKEAAQPCEQGESPGDVGEATEEDCECFGHANPLVNRLREMSATSALLGYSTRSIALHRSQMKSWERLSMAGRPQAQRPRLALVSLALGLVIGLG
jgi:hypothetical protein